MTTDWKWKVYLFVRASDVTTANKRKFADIYVDNGSLETQANELKMFDSVVRLSTTGAEPAQAYGINSPVKLSMRDGFKALLDSLTNARYAIVANTKLPNFEDNELVMTNFPVTPNGQIVSWDDAFRYLENEFGLKVIPPPPMDHISEAASTEATSFVVEETLVAEKAVVIEEDFTEITREETVPTVSLFGRDVPISSRWTWEKIIKPLIKWVRQ